MSAMKIIARRSMSTPVNIADKLKRYARDERRKRIMAEAATRQQAQFAVIDYPTACERYKPVDWSTLTLGIITADRAGIPTIYATLNSIRRAGFNQVIHIFTEAKTVSDAALLKADNRIKIFRQAEAAGCVPNWKRAAAWFLANTRTRWVMIMQDDIEWCDNGAEILMTTLTSIDKNKAKLSRHRIGLLSPYTSPAMVASAVTGTGWTEARFYGHTKGLWGALALCFPYEILAAILGHPRFKAHTSTRALDYVIGDTLRYHMEPPLDIKVHVPSLVEHTGDNSTVYAAQAVRAPHISRLRHGYRYAKDTAKWFHKI